MTQQKLKKITNIEFIEPTSQHRNNTAYKKNESNTSEPAFKGGGGER